MLHLHLSVFVERSHAFFKSIVTRFRFSDILFYEKHPQHTNPQVKLRTDCVKYTYVNNM